MDKQALIDLRDKVKAGDDLFPSDFPSEFPKVPRAIGAFEGSLDAAKKLHDALFGGWHIIIYGNTNFSATVQSANERWKKYSHTDETPARAWLIAILSALIEGE